MKWVPKRTNILVWRIFKGRMPVRKVLSTMGIGVNNLNCPVCDKQEETVDHIFLKCEKASYLWDKLCTWWGLQQIYSNTVEDLWSWSISATNQKGRKRGVQLAMAAIFKGLWETRNEKVFQDKTSDIEMVFKGVQETSYLWISSRNRRIKGDFSVWIDNHFDVF